LAGSGTNLKLRDTNAEEGSRGPLANGLKTVPTPNAHSDSGKRLHRGGVHCSIPARRQREVRRGPRLPSSCSYGRYSDQPSKSRGKCLLLSRRGPHGPFPQQIRASSCCGKRLCTCPMGEESCLGGFGKGPIAEREFGSSGPSRPRKRVYRHSNAPRHEGATKELMSQGRFLLPSDIGPHCPFPQQVRASRYWTGPVLYLRTAASRSPACPGAAPHVL